MNAIRKVFVAGPASAARQAIVRRLMASGFVADQIDTWDESDHSLYDQAAVRSYLRDSTPDHIYVAVGPWGNPSDNSSRRGTYMGDALLGPVQLIHEAMYAGVRKLLFIASHQVYGGCPVLPMAEEDLAFARPDRAREPLAIAHMAGIRLCEAYTHEFGELLGLTYRSVVVGNLYGPGDDLQPSTAGELLTLMRHIHQAKTFKLSSVNLRCNGFRRADWLYVDDMAEACIGLLDLPDRSYRLLTDERRPHVNLGSGRASTTLELAQAVAKVVGYRGCLNVDGDVADEGADFYLDTHRMRSTGWAPQIELETGLAHMYRDYRQQEQRLAAAS
ncbi:NAD-dependent epimerase/dehydratase family protein [Hydrogenophaga sp. BPS33]|uniref:NAD-dependent epimerase/dehydratase family protein n=1 Tax=Hydrogenophaga sp. BPS33 TaxID=2651974 RepID=UPI00132034FA|nr:NAD-dependent epimerase/dehydratase family protein [Hydrogenophaga sp. BPS33]QHE87164.1 NAD-dependent epimerase/dehydratase family protein [Hydrogenophaga sp. BPS33]